MNQSLTITHDQLGFHVATETATTLARNATEVALAVMHVFGSKSQQLDDKSVCPFCRDKKQLAHGYNWRGKASA